MNEQIRKLAEQAGDSLVDSSLSDWSIPNEFIEKFDKDKDENRFDKKIFLPDEKFDAKIFLDKLCEIYHSTHEQMHNNLSYMTKDIFRDANPTRRFLFIFQNHLWPKQYVAALLWLEKNYKDKTNP